MKKTHIDQLNRTVEIEENPQRIISLVPSQTEYLADLGLEKELVGITKFCIHPEEIFRNKTRVGGTKQLNFDKIAALQPDLIIANKEENSQADIEYLSQHYPIWISDIITFDDALEMMLKIGEITNKKAEAENIVQRISEYKNSFEKFSFPSIKTLYLIWKNPYMAAAKGTFINEIMLLANFENVIDESRYPELDEEKIKNLKPELILLSSEPYPFKEKHIEALQQLLPTAKIILADGEMFSWYGSRLLKTFNYLGDLRRELG